MFNASWFNSNGSHSQKSLCWRRGFFSCKGGCASLQELWKLPLVPDSHYRQGLVMSSVLGRGAVVIHWEEVQLFHIMFLSPTISALGTMPKPLIMRLTINRQILEELGIQDHLTCLLRNLYADQEAAVRTGHGTDWFQIGKGVRQGCI